MLKSKLNSIYPATVIAGIFLFLPFLSTAQGQSPTIGKNELSVSIERIRAGWEPVEFFDGGSVGLSYNRTIVPYVLFHSELSFSRIFLSEPGELNFLAERHHNSMIISDIGLELIPVYTKYFQLRAGFSGSLQYRQTSSGMDPERKFAAQRDNRVYFFNYSALYHGIKFELKTPVNVTETLFITPTAGIRSYSGGKYEIPRSFEFGIQGTYQF